MAPALAISLRVLLALHWSGASLGTGPEASPIAWPQLASAEDCASNQGAQVNSLLGINLVNIPPQGACLPGQDGEPGNLIGFAFPVLSCQKGMVKRTSVEFRGHAAGDLWQLYLWRDQGGIPVDACGLECAVASNPLGMADAGPTVETYDWRNQDCPCSTFDSEKIYIGVVYVNVSSPPDWMVGRENAAAGPGWGYVNLSGRHGDWDDLHPLGFGNKWGVENIIGSECGGSTSVGEGLIEGTWGAVKSLYR